MTYKGHKIGPWGFLNPIEMVSFKADIRGTEIVAPFRLHEISDKIETLYIINRKIVRIV